MASYHRSRQYDRQPEDRYHQSEETFRHDPSTASYTRRHTEPHTVHRHWDDEGSTPNRPMPHRASTYNQWDDQHRQKAMKAPMVEYISEEPRRTSEDVPPQRSCRCNRVRDEDEDEEAPMTIPKSYHYDPKVLHSCDGHYAQCSPRQSQSPHEHRSGSPRYSEDSHGYPVTKAPQQQQQQPHSGFDKNALIDKITDYVVSRSGTHSHLNDKSRRLIQDLSIEILHALKTGSIDHIPKDLLHDVKDLLIES